MVIDDELDLYLVETSRTMTIKRRLEPVYPSDMILPGDKACGLCVSIKNYLEWTVSVSGF